MRTRITEMLGIDYPIIQAPMSQIARSQLASAVSNAGGLGILETGAFTRDEFAADIARMRELTDKPFGVNVTMLTKREPVVIDIMEDHGVHFVTTSAGDPTRYTDMLHEKGFTVFHVVPTLNAAMKAVGAGVDGLVVEGSEGGGFKSPKDVSTMVLIPLVRSRTDIPIIAAGGIGTGAGLAGALALGADGVQMGTRMVSAAESPVHDNWKNAIVNARETDTVFLSRFEGPSFRALRTTYSTELERLDKVGMRVFERMTDLYFGGDMEAAIALMGQVAGLIDEVMSARDILWSMVAECRDAIARVEAMR